MEARLNPSYDSDFDPFEPMLAEPLDDTADLIGVTFASGRHESDLVSYLSRVQRLAGE